MNSTISLYNVAFDCSDPYALAQFWSKVFDHPMSDEDQPGDPEAEIALPGGPNLFFQRVPEPKAVKNRLHICLRPDGQRDMEVERLLALGATVVEDKRGPEDGGWFILADPEGNEFCVLHRNVGRPATEARQ